MIKPSVKSHLMTEINEAWVTCPTTSLRKFTLSQNDKSYGLGLFLIIIKYLNIYWLSEHKTNVLFLLKRNSFVNLPNCRFSFTGRIFQLVLMKFCRSDFFYTGLPSNDNFISFHFIRRQWLTAILFFCMGYNPLCLHF